MILPAAYLQILRMAHRPGRNPPWIRRWRFRFCLLRIATLTVATVPIKAGRKLKLRKLKAFVMVVLTVRDYMSGWVSCQCKKVPKKREKLTINLYFQSVPFFLWVSLKSTRNRYIISFTDLNETNEISPLVHSFISIRSFADDQWRCSYFSLLDCYTLHLLYHSLHWISFWPRVVSRKMQQSFLKFFETGVTHLELCDDTVLLDMRAQI